MWQHKSTGLKINSNIFKNNFLFNNFIQTIFETCENWLKNCGFDNTIFFLIAAFKSAMISDFCLYTWSLENPHKK